MLAPKLFLLNTDLFLDRWLESLRKEHTWKRFISIVRKDTGKGGLAESHEAYFLSPQGKAAIRKATAAYTEFHSDNNINLPKNLEEAVIDYFYNEKVLDKMNNIRSRPNMKIKRLDDGWKTRPCVKKSGGKKARDWTKVSKDFARFIE